MQKRLLSLILLFIISSLTLFGCGNNNAPVDSITYEEFPEKVKELGVEFETVEMIAEVIGAQEGIKLDTEDYGNCELYRFDPDSEAYKTLEKEGSLELFGQKYEFLTHDGFGFLIDDEFPEYDQVIELFNRLRQ